MKAIFFDLDGTLIDSSPDLVDAVNFMLKSINKESFEFEMVRSWIGGGAKKLVQRALNKAGVEYKDEYLEIFMNHYEKNLINNTILFDDVIEVLDELQKEYILTLITNKPYKFAIPILEYFKMDKYFKIILGAESLEHKKPHPLPLLHCIDELNLNKVDVIMVGDSKNDILSAQNAGIKSILVTYGFDEDELNPTYKIDNLKEITQCLK